MTRLEDELRAAFATRTADLPELDDVAGRAIRRARRIRRRQTALAGLAVVITISLVGIGLLRLPGQGGREPLVTDASAMVQFSTVLGIRLDLRVGNELWTADGRRLDLPGAGAVTWVYRVPAGWVYRGTGGTLRMILTDGVPGELDQPVDTAVVSADGQRIAWSSRGSGGELLSVGELTGTGVEPLARTKLAQQAEPVAIVGSAVMVSQPAGATAPGGYDVWYPPGTFAPTWPIKLAAVYGDGGGDTVVGLANAADSVDTTDPAGRDINEAAARAKARVPDGPDVKPMGAAAGPCLIRYPLAKRAVSKVGGAGDCALGLPTGAGRATTSPDGQWLAASASSGMVFVSLNDTAKPFVRTCAAKARSAPVWEGDSSVLVATGEGLVRCGLDGSRRVIPVDGLRGSDWDVVPALGT